MTLDWNKILDEQDGGDDEFAPLPVGPYNVVVEDAEARTASTGRQMLNLSMKVQGGPYDNRMVWTNVVFTPDNPKAMRFTLKKLKALGITAEWLAQESPAIELIAKKAIGARIVAEVTQREWEGEMRNDVKSLKARTDAAPEATADIPTPDAGGDEPPTPAGF